MKKHIVVIALTILSINQWSKATLLYDWDSDPYGTVNTVSDPIGDVIADASNDIVGIWYASDPSTVYFRLDLAEAPVQNAGDFAPEVSIQIDYQTGGGSSADTGYIASPLSGIDAMLVNHYTLAGGWTMDHAHGFSGIGSPPPSVSTYMLSILGGISDKSEGGGTIIQWAIPFSGPIPEFTFYGATLSVNSPATYDTTRGLTVPEPATLTFMALGFIAMNFVRKPH